MACTRPCLPVWQAGDLQATPRIGAGNDADADPEAARAAASPAGMAQDDHGRGRRIPRAHRAGTDPRRGRAPEGRSAPAQGHEARQYQNII